MKIGDHREAQGAVQRAQELRAGARVVSPLIPAHIAQAMKDEADSLEAEVATWCAAQPDPELETAVAYRRFWQVGMAGTKLPVC